MFLTAVVFAAAAAAAPPPVSLGAPVDLSLPCLDTVCMIRAVVVRDLVFANATLAAANEALRFELAEAKKTQTVEKKCGTVTIVPKPAPGGRS